MLDSKPKPFPLSLLPAVLARFVREASASISNACDPSYVALPLLASLGRAIGNKRVIQLKPDWTEPPVIWAAVISNSGTFKSPSQKAATKYLSAQQKKVRSGGADVTYFTTDATYAGVRDALAVDPKLPPPLELKDSSLVIMPDELIGILNSVSKGGQSSSKKGEWISWWSGTEMNVLRHKKKIHIPIVTVSLIGTIQPEVFKQAMLTQQKAHVSDGMCARFLLTWQPTTETIKWSDDAISLSSRLKMQKVFDALFEMNSKRHHAGLYFMPDPIKLSPTAKQMFTKFFNQQGEEQKLLSDELQAAWQKLTAYAARIALIFQYVIWADKEVDLTRPDLEISGEAMQKSIRLVEWFKGETTRIYGLFTESTVEQKQRTLLETMRKHEGKMTPRMLQRCRNRMTVPQAEAELDGLVDAGLAKRQDIVNKNRSVTYEYRLVEKRRKVSSAKKPAKT